MARYDWREDDQLRGPGDMRSADYTTDFRYEGGRDVGQREFSSERSFQPGAPDDYRAAPYSWRAEPDGFGGGAREGRTGRRRSGVSDRVLWTVIVERLEHERRLNLGDVEVILQDGEVTLNGSVRNKADKRRIEDIADIDGVRHVQNNLRVRGRSWF